MNKRERAVTGQAISLEAASGMNVPWRKGSVLEEGRWRVTESVVNCTELRER